MEAEAGRLQKLRSILRGHAILHEATIQTVELITTLSIYASYATIITSFFCVISYWESMNLIINYQLFVTGSAFCILVMYLFDFAYQITDSSMKLKLRTGNASTSKERRKFFRSCRVLWWKLGILVVKRDSFLNDLHEIILNGVITLVVNT